jgi:hypothetical protein
MYVCCLWAITEGRGTQCGQTNVVSISIYTLTLFVIYNTDTASKLDDTYSPHILNIANKLEDTYSSFTHNIAGRRILHFNIRFILNRVHS